MSYGRLPDRPITPFRIPTRHGGGPADPGGRPVAFFSVFRILLLYSMGFVGFHILLTFVFLAGHMDVSRNYTIPFRGTFLAVAVAIFVCGLMARKVCIRHPVIPMVVGFWFLYLMRILYAYFAGTSLGTPWNDYLLKTYGIIVIPSLAFLVPLTPRENRLARIVLFISVLVAGLVLTRGYWDYVNISSYRELRHHAIDTYYLISPHTVSEIGGLTVLLSLYFLLMAPGSIRRGFLISMPAIGLGIALMFWGASRYPFVSLACVFPLTLIYSRYRINRVKAAGITLCVSGVLLLIMYVAAKFVGNMLLLRFMRLFDQLQIGSMEAGSGRLQLWISGLQQFLANPIFGSGLEEQISRYIVHQRYLEGYMATGFLGGTLLLISSLYGVKIAWRVMRQQPQFGWLSLLFLYRFVAGWITSSLFDPVYWYSLFALTSVYIWYLEKPPRSSRKTRW